MPNTESGICEDQHGNKERQDDVRNSKSRNADLQSVIRMTERREYAFQLASSFRMNCLVA